MFEPTNLMKHVQLFSKYRTKFDEMKSIHYPSQSLNVDYPLISQMRLLANMFSLFISESACCQLVVDQ
ncbi:MAG: hypothetical protein COA38_00535 [Fluviicola sp.]|nr:MAG: hypothetical protein COA38_00535 [Fluviicola sp.]